MTARVASSTKRSSASTSSAHPRRHYYGEPSYTIASLAACQAAIARAELDAKDSKLASMRAALEGKIKDFANVNKKPCDVKAEVGRLMANAATSTSKLADDIKIEAAVSRA